MYPLGIRTKRTPPRSIIEGVVLVLGHRFWGNRVDGVGDGEVEEEIVGGGGWDGIDEGR